MELSPHLFDRHRARNGIPWLHISGPHALDHIAALAIRVDLTFCGIIGLRRSSRPMGTERSCGSTPAAFRSPLLRLVSVWPKMWHRVRRRGRTKSDQCSVHCRIGIYHFLRSGVDGPKPGSRAVLCIRYMFKGLLKTCGYIAVGLGVLNLIAVLHIEYPQGSGIREQKFSTALCKLLCTARLIPT